MRSITSVAAALALAASPAAVPLSAPPAAATAATPTATAAATPTATAAATPTATAAATPTATAAATAAATDDNDNDDEPKWRKLTSFRISPEAPHQNDVLRVLLHCPVEANHAILGSTAFMLKGSWRRYREVGVGLTSRGFGRRAVIISRYAPPGDHVVRMKCVKVTIHKPSGLRKVKVLSRDALPLTVRHFHIGQYF
ncbi:hypothetical protein AB0C27_40010 [Nonomuraea sp. NPDC048882]|uniref:hypothetical protein n=1 Tax=Nonomuraea sp. NPDC048882 TaxID=3154347 RepID=UPI0033CFF321